MQIIDLLISPRWIIPVTPEAQVFENCAIAVDKGIILGIYPEHEALKKFQAKQVTKLTDHAVIPGLINAHGHSAMTLMRGFADDYPLHTWLNDYIWPAEGKWVSPEFVRDGTDIAIAEMIRAGTTCFSDMYFFPDQVVESAINAGIRAQVAFPILEFPTAWARDADDYIHKGLQLRDNFKASDSIKIAFGPHAVYTVDTPTLTKIAAFAEELDTGIQIHLHETAQEVADFEANNGKRPVEHLAELGLLSPLTQCVHMTQLNDSDIQLIAQNNSHIIHCPQSNMKLASGAFNIKPLMEQGINIGLGTDGEASNNSLSLFSEMKTASLLAKLVSADAATLNAHQTLKMATINGAKALGIDHVTGSLEAGKSADITAVDLGEIESQPLYNAVSQLVYTEATSKVTHVWCKGEALLENRELKTLYSNELLAKAKHWQSKIAS